MFLLNDGRFSNQVSTKYEKMSTFKKILITLAIALFIAGLAGCAEKAPPEVQEQIDKLSSTDSEERVRAILELGRMHKSASSAIPYIIKSLKDKDRRVRWSAVIVLGNMEDKRAVKPLIKVLKNDEKWEVRLRAAEALGNLGSLGYKKAVKPLIAALKDERLVIRAEAALSLGYIRNPRAIEPLIDILGEEDGTLQENAAIALRKITKEKLGDGQEEWLSWWEENKDKFD